MKPSELVNRGFCQGHFACDGNGNNVDYRSDLAVSFCAYGAVRRCLCERKVYTYIDLMNDKIRRIENQNVGIAAYNDTHTKEDVVELMEVIEEMLGEDFFK